MNNKKTKRERGSKTLIKFQDINRYYHIMAL